MSLLHTIQAIGTNGSKQNGHSVELALMYLCSSTRHNTKLPKLHPSVPTVPCAAPQCPNSAMCCTPVSPQYHALHPRRLPELHPSVPTVPCAAPQCPHSAMCCAPDVCLSCTPVSPQCHALHPRCLPELHPSVTTVPCAAPQTFS